MGEAGEVRRGTGGSKSGAQLQAERSEAQSAFQRVVAALSMSNLWALRVGLLVDAHRA